MPSSIFSPALRDQTATQLFAAASVCTEPVAQCHECYHRIATVDALFPQATRIHNQVRKSALLAQSLAWGLVALPTAPIGIALRWVASAIARRAFLHFRGAAREKDTTAECSLFSWNVCCLPGGFSITHGGVLPWRDRFAGIVDRIREQNADIVCLQEVFDVEAAFALVEALQVDYAHIYYNIGPRAVGMSSALFVASALPVAHPHFVPFPKDMIIGAVRHSEKGYFAFDAGGAARIITTHLLHSEEPAFPTQEEQAARAREMEYLVDQVRRVQGIATLLTGDFNLDKAEYKSHAWSDHFMRDAFKEPTWGGDQWCNTLLNKRASGPLQLDYTLALRGTVERIHTRVVSAGFMGTAFRSEALSDHDGLFSRVTLLQ